MAAVDVVDEYLEQLPGQSRRLAHGEWGVTVESDQAGGRPLHVGVTLSEGVLRAKAHALDSPDGIDAWMLLWWNRQTRMARFGCTREREVWVHADLPVAAVDAAEVDRLLGLVVEGAIAVREYQRSRTEPATEAGAGWLSGGAGSAPQAARSRSRSAR
ncbi:MAG: YbjN domain-containing protein [Thermoleophilaceae bacterium]